MLIHDESLPFAFSIPLSFLSAIPSPAQSHHFSFNSRSGPSSTLPLASEALEAVSYPSSQTSSSTMKSSSVTLRLPLASPPPGEAASIWTLVRVGAIVWDVGTAVQFASLSDLWQAALSAAGGASMVAHGVGRKCWASTSDNERALNASSGLRHHVYTIHFMCWASESTSRSYCNRCLFVQELGVYADLLQDSNCSQDSSGFIESVLHSMAVQESLQQEDCLPCRIITLICVASVRVWETQQGTAKARYLISSEASKQEIYWPYKLCWRYIVVKIL